MAQLAKLEYMEQTKADQELHNQITQQLEQEQYQKHHDMCEEIIDQVVDYSCKVAEYRELTEKFVFHVTSIILILSRKVSVLFSFFWVLF